jgi:hypothetical protein
LYAKSQNNADLTADFIVEKFKRAYSKEKNYDDVFGVDSDYDEGRKVCYVRTKRNRIFF